MNRLLADAADLAADLQRGIDRLTGLDARVLETVPEEVRECAGL